jgi:hypothetical protein
VSSARTTALVAGIFFVLTFLAGIPAPLLYGPVLDTVDAIISAGADTRVRWGAFLEVILVIANVGTAVVLFPIVKRQSESIALGYVATRVLESTLIVVGMVSVLSLVTVRQDLAGATGAAADSLVTLGPLLVSIHDWLSLFGPAFCAGLGNGLLLGYLMYRSGLVPRGMALLGLIGGPLTVAAATAVLFGLFERSSGPALIAALPEIAWEASLGIYLIVKGFKPAAILRDAGVA